MDTEFNSKVYTKQFEYGKSDILRIKELLNIVGSGLTVLDLGCGDGTIGAHLRKQNNVVTGLDVSEAVLNLAKQKLDYAYKADLSGDWASSTPELQGKTYDVVIGAEILEHIFDTDRFLANIKKVLKPDGNLVLSTPNVASLGRRLMLLLGINPILEVTARKSDAGHVRYFTPYS